MYLGPGVFYLFSCYYSASSFGMKYVMLVRFATSGSLDGCQYAERI